MAKYKCMYVPVHYGAVPRAGDVGGHVVVIYTSRVTNIVEVELTNRLSLNVIYLQYSTTLLS